MPDSPVTDPDEIARYVASARDLYLTATNAAYEIADPPVVVRTPTGARVMAWLPVADEDVTA